MSGLMTTFWVAQLIAGGSLVESYWGSLASTRLSSWWSFNMTMFGQWRSARFAGCLLHRPNCASPSSASYRYPCWAQSPRKKNLKNFGCRWYIGEWARYESNNLLASMNRYKFWLLICVSAVCELIIPLLTIANKGAIEEKGARYRVEKLLVSTY